MAYDSKDNETDRVNLQTRHIDWNLYAGKPKYRLLKQVMSQVGNCISWNADHFAQMKVYDFKPSAPMKTLCKYN